MLILIFSTTLYCAEAPDPQLMALKKDLPTANIPMQDRLTWLWNCSVRCDQSRRYSEAEAYMSGVLAVVPDNGHALASMACYIGKQGRYEEALDITNSALLKEEKDSVQLMCIKATWLAHMGKHDEAEKIWKDLAIPSENESDAYCMYWIGRAFYLARIENDETKLEEAMKKGLLGGSHPDHWLSFFKNDVSFDKFRDRDWYKALVK